jgi:hypothetical protein
MKAVHNGPKVESSRPSGRVAEYSKMPNQPYNEPYENDDSGLLDALCAANWRAHQWEMRYNQLNRTHVQEHENVLERIKRIERLFADI